MNNLSYFKNLASKAASSISNYAQSFQTLADRQYLREQNVTLLTDQQIKDKLVSQYESEIYDGLKNIIAVQFSLLNMLAGKDVSKFFPDSVIVLPKSSFDLKKLTYIIMTQTFGQNQDNSLMPINLLQKETQTKEPTRRADAIKVLGDISQNEVYPLLYEIAKKGIQDPNPHVKKISLMTLQKIIQQTDFDISDHIDEIIPLIQGCLQDYHLMVLQQALIVGYSILKPIEFHGVLHSQFNRVTEILDQYDPFIVPYICQIIAELMNVKDSFTTALQNDQALVLLNLYLYLQGLREVAIEQNDFDFVVKIFRRIMQGYNFDIYYFIDQLLALETLQIFISQNKPLLQQPNKQLNQLLKIKVSDLEEVACKKLQILQYLYTELACEQSIEEIIVQSKSPKKYIRVLAIRSLGDCGHLLSMKNDITQLSNSQTMTIGLILQTLINLLKQNDDQIMTETIIALQKMIVNGESEQSHAIILYCMRNVDKITSSKKAKATMIYLIKEFIARFPTLSKETFRRLVKGVVQEIDEQVKIQIIKRNLIKAFFILFYSFKKIQLFYQFIQLSKAILNKHIITSILIQSLLNLSKYSQKCDYKLLKQKKFIKLIFSNNLIFVKYYYYLRFNISNQRYLFENNNQKRLLKFYSIHHKIICIFFSFLCSFSKIYRYGKNISTLNLYQQNNYVEPFQIINMGCQLVAKNNYFSIDNMTLTFENKDYLKIGTFNEILSLNQKLESSKIDEIKAQLGSEDITKAYYHRRFKQQQGFNQHDSLGTTNSNDSPQKLQSANQQNYPQQNVTSMSSESYKSLDQALKNNEQQQYKQSHFTVKDKQVLKQDYEDFFSQQEEPTQIQTQTKQNSAGDAQNNSQVGSPSKISVSQNVNKKAINEDEYEYYDEDGEGQQ